MLGACRVSSCGRSVALTRWGRRRLSKTSIVSGLATTFTRRYSTGLFRGRTEVKTPASESTVSKTCARFVVQAVGRIVPESAQSRYTSSQSRRFDITFPAAIYHATVGSTLTSELNVTRGSNAAPDMNLTTRPDIYPSSLQERLAASWIASRP
ncbi:hypothetical protein FKP32DRAFT_656757 [Trametes sanguinea]|nr:hypothetical protein FKP32DRAFT_656757 [Trametes sanguinea]